MNTRTIKHRKMHRKIFLINDIEITTREIMFSTIIALVLLAVGFLISESIQDKAAEHAEIYIKAIPIESKEHFDHGMKTSIGNALVYGKFKAIDTVSFPELQGEYYAVRKETERYTMHTRTVTDKDSKGKTTTRTETYYTWDNINTDKHMCKTFEFMGNEFSSDKISISAYQSLRLSSETVSLLYQGKISGNYIYDDSSFFASVGDLRHEFSFIPTEFNGTIFAKLENNTFEHLQGKGAVNVEHEKTILQVVENAKNAGNTWVIIFWIFWTILIIGCIVLFVYFDNKWLE